MVEHQVYRLSSDAKNCVKVNNINSSIYFIYEFKIQFTFYSFFINKTF